MLMNKESTTTTVILDYLRHVDDFKTTGEVTRYTARLYPGTPFAIVHNRVQAGLHHLKHRNAVDFMRCDGRLFWYARPIGDDNRTRQVTERVPESKPRKTHSRKKRDPLTRDEQYRGILDIKGDKRG